MSVQKKCLKKNKYFKNKFLAKNVFINGDIGGMGDHSCYMFFQAEDGIRDKGM